MPHGLIRTSLRRSVHPVRPAPASGRTTCGSLEVFLVLSGTPSPACGNAQCGRRLALMVTGRVGDPGNSPQGSTEVTVTKIINADAKERRQQRIVLSLIVLCAAGLLYVLYGYYRVTRTTVLPEDGAQVTQAVDRLKATGIVRRLDPRGRLMVVNPDKWSSLTANEKIGIVTRVARQCADQTGDRTWALTVVDGETHSIVAELGTEGLRIQ